MQVIVLGPNLPDQSKGQFHVHAAGCGDLKRGWQKRYAADSPPMSATSMIELSENIYSDIINEADEYERGDYVSEFFFLPCCKALPMDEPEHIIGSNDPLYTEAPTEEEIAEHVVEALPGDTPNMHTNPEMRVLMCHEHFTTKVEAFPLSGGKVLKCDCCSSRAVWRAFS